MGWMSKLSSTQNWLLPLLSSVITLLLLLSTVGSTTTITYKDFIPNLPPPDHVAFTLRQRQLSLYADPTWQSYTNITILLTVPNHLIPAFAANPCAATLARQSTLIVSFLLGSFCSCQRVYIGFLTVPMPKVFDFRGVRRCKEWTNLGV